MESLFSILLFIGFLYLMMRYGCGAHMHGGGCGHSSHGHSKTGENSTGHTGPDAKEIIRDPVCGMELKPLGRRTRPNTVRTRSTFARATVSKIQGETRVFCGDRQNGEALHCIIH